MEVDAIEQGSGHARLIVGGAARGAGAGLARIAEMAAATGVHGRDQLHPGRKGQVAVRARDADGPGFERLAQAIEDGALELGQFVEEQDAQVF
jgi:hypothetical protein